MERRINWWLFGVLLVVSFCCVGYMSEAVAATEGQVVKKKAEALVPITLKVSNPLGKLKGAIKYELAPRVKDLNGKTIGLMCDWLFGHTDDFANLKKELNARFKGLKFIEWRSEATVPLDEKGRIEIVGQAKKADAVIGFTGL